MKQVFVVYNVDVWHTRASRELMAICTSKELAVKHIKEYAKNEGEILSDDDLFLLDTINQTQNYTGTGEFQIDSHPVNTLLTIA